MHLRAQLEAGTALLERAPTQRARAAAQQADPDVGLDSSRTVGPLLGLLAALSVVVVGVIVLIGVLSAVLR